MSAKRYTAWDDEAVDGFIHERLSRVVQAVVALMGSDLAAILLSGGFGRGEGGVLVRPDGRFHVINDFDLELIYREPYGAFVSKLLVQWRHRRALQCLAESLAAEFDMKQVDLSLRAAGTLDTAVPKLVDFDLRYGHRLLWGDSDPCDRMRSFASSEIPAFEGTWLLRNRGLGLVLARLYLDRGRLHDDNVENFYIEVNKAALAMGDAQWILSGRYSVQYADRAAAFEQMDGLGFARQAELAACYRQAAEYKLRPVASQYPCVAPAELWDRMANLYRDFFVWFEGKRAGQPFSDLEAYARWVDDLPVGKGGGGLRRWADSRLGISGACPPALTVLKYDPARSVLCIASLVSSRAGDAAAARVLERWAVPAAGISAAWRARALGLLSLMHPSGEVGRFLARSSIDEFPAYEVAT